MANQRRETGRVVAKRDLIVGNGVLRSGCGEICMATAGRRGERRRARHRVYGY